MASSSSSSLLLLIITALVFSHSIAKKATPFRPKALVLPVIKDTSTNHIQYITEISQRTPLVPVKLALDLGGDFLWIDCHTGYASSSYHPSRCRSAACKLSGSAACGDCAGGPRPGCNAKTCSLMPYNPFIATGTVGELATDLVSVQSTNGFNPGRPVSDPNLLFVCGGGAIQQGLARGAAGVAGLGRRRLGLPSRFAAGFRFSRKFALCLSSRPGLRGVMFFGNEPYALLPNRVVSDSLTYTPLIQNHARSSEYFIGVKSIMINGNTVKGINSTLLSIDRKGNGGAKISTVEPYTVLQTSIYKAVLDAFVNTLAAVPKVKAVAPFGACYAAASLGSTRVGVAVPQIDLILKNQGAVWTIFGDNSMVEVGNGVYCLGFVDGGLRPQTSIVIGAHQIENNLLQFDLAASRLGFSSSLLFMQTTCSNFNFTSVA